MEALLDSNFLLTCIKQKIDFFEEIKLMGISIIIPKQVLNELKFLEQRDNSKSDSNTLTADCLGVGGTDAVGNDGDIGGGGVTMGGTERVGDNGGVLSTGVTGKLWIKSILVKSFTSADKVVGGGTDDLVTPWPPVNFCHHDNPVDWGVVGVVGLTLAKLGPVGVE